MSLTTRADAVALLAAVCEQPEDDLPRLAYADWCDEQGDTDRAEFIRVQLNLARMEKDAGASARKDELFCTRTGKWTGWHRWGKRCRCELCVLRRREYETSKRHRIWEWCKGIPPGSYNVYRRGFVAEAHLDAASFTDAHAAAMFAGHPIEEVRLTDKKPVRLGPDWTWIRADEVLHEPAALPSSLFDLLTGEGGLAAYYDSEADALTDLSRACVAWGRSEARKARG